ncbi:MAG: hypothetical protein K8F60_18555 [Melioribacteraceae bacterium]|nr:hypothetical protein [Melioribacteraceae bacterium]
MSITKIYSDTVKSNHCQGSYRPRYFDYTEFRLTEVIFESVFFKDSDPEMKLLQSNFSFAYLREDKLRTIQAFDSNNEMVEFEKFTDRLKIDIQSTNLFKTGKYLSRIFRPSRYGGFYKGIRILNNHSIPGSKIDGLSLISVDLAKSLGVNDAVPNQSAQFTLFYKGGLVKGHCVYSDKITADVVIYGSDNIKSEIRFNSDHFYIAIEPVKLSNQLRLDIQSMLNLWSLFGQEQYFTWAVNGINQFQRSLKAGDLSKWFDNLSEIKPSQYDETAWTLQKAIWHKIDYRMFPGLVRQAWSIFRKSILSYAENSKSTPVFRIPVPEGKRGYFRLDIRKHNQNGDLQKSEMVTNTELDRFGNIWIHPDIIEDFLAVKGGADLDDSAGVIPIEDGKAVIYRNPNQFGEYGIHSISYDGFSPSVVNKVIGYVPYKKQLITKSDKKQKLTGNRLFDKYAAKVSAAATISYTRDNLIRTYAKISTNSANVGLAANAEMIRSSIGISNKSLMKMLIRNYNWNLERVIDSTVKEGMNCDDDMAAVSDMQTFVVENSIPLPKSIIHRLPERLSDKALTADYHPLDELFEAIKLLIHKADIDILGSGSVSKGNRVRGYIDTLEIPLIQIGIANNSNQMLDAAVNLLSDYNKSVAVMMDRTEDLPVFVREIKRREEIETIQQSLLEQFNQYTESERIDIIKCWAYEIYRSDRAVHDSILWIRGIADYTIQMLANIGVAHHIKRNGSINRYHEIKPNEHKVDTIRLWSKESIDASALSKEASVLIENRKALIGDSELNVGDECIIRDGIYSISRTVQSISRKNRGVVLRNSITLYLQ